MSAHSGSAVVPPHQHCLVTPELVAVAAQGYTAVLADRGAVCQLEHTAPHTALELEVYDFDVRPSPPAPPRPFDAGCVPLGYSGNPGVKPPMIT